MRSSPLAPIKARCKARVRRVSRRASFIDHAYLNASTGSSKLARQAGFTIAEMQILFHGFAADTPPAARWQALAQQKLGELDTLITVLDLVRTGAATTRQEIEAQAGPMRSRS